MSKASVTLGGVAIAANTGFAWRLMPGTAPYQTTVQFHKDDWARLKSQMGKPLELKIKNADGDVESFKDVYILHEIATDSLFRTTVMVSDKRWKWGYKLICKDYNIQRKTGSRQRLAGTVPLEAEQTVDQYDYLPHTINQATSQRWKAKEMVEDVLELLEPKIEGRNRDPDYQWEVESWPLQDDAQDPDQGTITVRDLQLRDNGDHALARALEHVPGADVYVRQDGTICIYDASAIEKARDYKERLPVPQRDGEVPVWVDRKKIRPSKIGLLYQREIEIMFTFEDNWTDTIVYPNRNEPFLENVIPTVDRETHVQIWDPETNQRTSADVPAGTWVRMDEWLYSMNQDRPSNSAYPWTFDTVQVLWFSGALDQGWGGGAQDTVEFDANIQARIDAFKTHFRRTYRINPRYAKRCEKITAIRVATLDPVTGAKLPAAIWGQASHIPTDKGVHYRGTLGRRLGTSYNVDWIGDNSDSDLLDEVPMPAKVVMVDEDLGIFSVEFLEHPYGLIQSWNMGLMEQAPGQPGVPTRDLEKQEEVAIGYGMAMEGATEGIGLARRMKMRVVLTVVPNSPNSKLQFHRKPVSASEISELFREELGIDSGDGPEMEVFVSPSEATARYQLSNTEEAANILPQLFGLVGDGEGYDPEAQQQQGGQGGSSGSGGGPSGQPRAELPGWQLVNEERHLDGHAKAMAASVLVNFADSLLGSLVTKMPPRISGSSDNAKLIGNIADITYRVAGFPSGKVDVVHTFPGAQRPINRMALLPNAARRYLLRQLPT